MKNLNIDKSAWKLVKFGDVIAEPKESVSDIVSSGLEHLVGLEHIESESIHLRRSASLQHEETTFTKVFRSGDVLFGRRRAYLKKAAQANFDGVCSGDITVFRAKKDLLPELLPFVVNNDKFFDYAVKHSAGGLSPRVKFKDLANYELLLPPKEQQAELAELLWAMDEVIEKDLAVLEKLVQVKQSLNDQYFGNYSTSANKIGDFTTKVGSGSTPRGGSKVYQKSGVVFIRSQNIFNGVVNFDDVEYISDEIDEKMSSTRVESGDVLLNITGASIGRSAVFNHSCRANVNQHVCIIRTEKQRLIPEFLCEFLNSRYGQSQIQKMQVGGNREGLNFATIRSLKFPEIEFEFQEKLFGEYKLINTNSVDIKSKITASKALQKSLINEIF